MSEIIIEGKRRRCWPGDLKRQIVQEAFAEGNLVGEVALRHDVDPSQIYAWRRQLRGRGAASFVPIEVGPEVGLPQVGLLSAPAQTEKCIEIAFANGNRVIVPASIEGVVLERLIAAVAR